MESEPCADRLRVSGSGKGDFNIHITVSIVALTRAPSFGWVPYLGCPYVLPFRVSLGVPDQMSAFWGEALCNLLGNLW